MVSIIYFSVKVSGWVSETFFQAALWFFKNLGWKKFSGLSPEILIEASFLLKPTRGSGLEGLHIGAYKSLLVGTKDRVIISPQYSKLALFFFSHILERASMLSNANSLEKLFHRIIFQRQKCYLHGHLHQSPCMGVWSCFFQGQCKLSLWFSWFCTRLQLLVTTRLEWFENEPWLSCQLRVAFSGSPQKKECLRSWKFLSGVLRQSIFPQR